MNSINASISVLSIFAIIFVVQAFIPTPGWEDEMVCKNTEHLTLPRSTCCRNMSYPVPFNYVTYWGACATAPSDLSQPLNATLWSMYSCIIGKALEGNPMDLHSFAMMMTKNFPENIKMNIMKQADMASPSSVGNLKMIREEYYKIELKECLQRDVTLPPMETCISDLERDHKHGGCCLKDQVPIATLIPYVPEKDILSVWQDLLETISANDPNKLPFNVQKACESSSVQIFLGKLSKDDLFKTPSLSQSIDIFAPPFISKAELDQLKQQILLGMTKSQTNANEPLEKPTLDAMEKYYMEYLQKELVGIKDEMKAKSMVVSCLFHQQVIQMLATTFKMKCLDGNDGQPPNPGNGK